MNKSIYFRQKILNHYKNPQNYGRLDNPDRSAEMINASCGDEIEIDLKIEKGKITDVGFEGRGCVISTASASMLTEYLKGKKLSEVSKITENDLVKLIGIEISPARLKCLLLPLEAALKAVA